MVQTKLDDCAFPHPIIFSGRDCFLHATSEVEFRGHCVFYGVHR